MRKRFTRKQLEELRDEVINKQQELIRMQEDKIGALQAELAQMKCDAEFEQMQKLQTQRLMSIVGMNYFPNYLCGFPEIY